MVHARKRLVVVGNGMVGHRFVESIASRGQAGEIEITVLGEEGRPAYDRANLSKFFEGGDAGKLALAYPEKYAAAGLRPVPIGSRSPSSARRAARPTTGST